MQSFADEHEQLIQTNHIENIFDYVDYVLLIKSNVEYLMKDGGNNSIWLSKKGTREGNIQTNIQYVIDKLKNDYNKKLFLQEGNNIIKDNKFIEYLINIPQEEIKYKWLVLYRGDINIPYKNRFTLKEIYVNNKEDILDITIGNYFDVKK